MKNLGKIIDKYDIITKEYLDNRIKINREYVVASSDDATTITLTTSRSNDTSVFLYLNGLLLEPTLHYTISSNTVTFVGYTLKKDDIISAVYIG